jgi:hypothetical protein
MAARREVVAWAPVLGGGLFFGLGQRAQFGL